MAASPPQPITQTSIVDNLDDNTLYQAIHNIAGTVYESLYDAVELAFLKSR